MNISGGCFCGAVEYEAEIDSERIAVCHCRDCQIFSGSAFRLACPAEPAGFRFTKGAPVYFDKTAASGKVRRMAFCGTCGTHLCSLPGSPEGEGGHVSVRVATAKNFAALAPVREVFGASRVSWLSPLAGMVQHPGMPR